MFMVLESGLNHRMPGDLRGGVRLACFGPVKMAAEPLYSVLYPVFKEKA
jgi:hypothetical protein